MNVRAYALLVMTMLFWGGNAVAGKLAIGHVSPMLLTAGRWGLACAVMLVIGWRHVRADRQALRRHLPLLLLLGLLGFSGFNIALYSALLYTGAINVSIEQAGMPMLIFAANFLIFRLRATSAQIVGFAISLVGVAVVAGHGDPLRLVRLDLNFGDALMLVAVIVYSAYTVLLRFKPDLHWQTVMIVMTASAFVTSLPFAWGEFAFAAGVFPDAEGWAIVAYTAIFPSLLAQAFYIRGVEMIGANRAGLFINLVPVFGTLLAIAILGETFQLYHAMALVMVLGGILLAEIGWLGRHPP